MNEWSEKYVVLGIDTHTSESKRLELVTSEGQEATIVISDNVAAEFKKGDFVSLIVKKITGK